MTTDLESGLDPSPQGAPTVPAWFRDLVWDSLLGGLCPLIPVPFLDDLALLWTRRRLVTRVAERHGALLLPGQVRRIAGARRGFSCLGLLIKVAIYPFRKILRKLLYFLSVKDAVDTFSLLFHQGYLFHRALDHGSLDLPGPSSDEAVDRTGAAVLGALEAIDTRPLGKIVLGVFRGSRHLVRKAATWVSSRALSRRSFARAEADGLDPDRLARESPATEELLDRLLATLWGEAAYRERLGAELVSRLEAPPPAAGLDAAD